MAKVEFEKQTCTRCGGTGKYSFNQMHGDMCYGCRGTGAQLTARGKAAAAFADEISETTVEQAYVEGLSVRVKGISKWVSVASIEYVPADQSGCASLNRRTGKMEPYAIYICIDCNGNRVISGPANMTVRRVITSEIVAAVADYQASLTKAGKPKKRVAA